MRNIPSTINEMISYTDGGASYDVKTLEGNANLQDNMGKVFVLYYGPDKDDFCLVLSSQDTGSLKYDPAIQSSLCYATFISNLFLEKLESMIEKEMERRKVSSHLILDVEDRMEMFLGIRGTFNYEINQFALYQVFQDYRDEIALHYKVTLSRRQQRL